MKTKIVIKSVVLGALALLPYVAHAGTEGHGGNAVICNGKSPVVLDYYNATLPTLGNVAPKLIDISQYSTQQVLDLADQQLRNTIYMKKDLDSALAEIGPMNDWTSVSLNQVDDSLEPYTLPPGCKRQTAAVRQDPVLMYGDPAVINLMSPAQRGVLLLHEAIYLIAARRGQNNSINVRTLVKAILEQNLSESTLASAIAGIGEDPLAFPPNTENFGLNAVPNGSYNFQHPWSISVNKTQKTAQINAINFEPFCTTGQVPHTMFSTPADFLDCMPSFSIDCSNSSWTQVHMEEPGLIIEGANAQTIGQKCTMKFTAGETGQFKDSRWEVYVTRNGSVIFLRDIQSIANLIFLIKP